jgi:Ran GTPase-activating protein (RanGAP) involved in mRNA processing and transport
LIKRTDRNGQSNHINVNHYNIGNGYAAALSSSMKHLNPKTLTLSHNKNTHGISRIVENLNTGLEKLDLSDNNVNTKTIMNLSNWLINHSNDLKLKILNISNNKLNDDTLLILCRGLRTAKPDLTDLDLSKNMMGDYSASVLGTFLELSYSMVNLNLSWNRITPRGGAAVFTGIQKGRNCRNVNMSYN